LLFDGQVIGAIDVGLGKKKQSRLAPGQRGKILRGFRGVQLKA